MAYVTLSYIRSSVTTLIVIVQRVLENEVILHHLLCTSIYMNEILLSQQLLVYINVTMIGMELYAYIQCTGTNMQVSDYNLFAFKGGVVTCTISLPNSAMHRAIRP